MLQLEQKTTKKRQVDKKTSKIEFETDSNSKKYKFETICDSEVYVNKSKNNLPDLYYLVS